MIRGSCLCCQVRYTVSGQSRPVVASHCRQCRKTSGHHVAATSTPREAIEIPGEVSWYQSSDSARLGFCSTCGSNLFRDCSGKNLSIFAGTLGGPTGWRFAGHIFCADKGDYYEITDGAAQAPGPDPILTTVVI